jgi:hypothetical protein
MDNAHEVYATKPVRIACLWAEDQTNLRECWPVSHVVRPSGVLANCMEPSPHWEADGHTPGQKILVSGNCNAGAV